MRFSVLHKFLLVLGLSLLTLFGQAQLQDKNPSKRQMLKNGMLSKSKNGKVAPTVKTKGYIWDPIANKYVKLEKSNDHKIIRYDAKKWKKKKAGSIVNNKKGIRDKKKARKKQGIQGVGKESKTLDSKDKKKKKKLPDF